MPSVPPKVGFVSLGCPKALVDSERILTQLRAEGYLVSPSYEQADLVIVNTCGFIDAAVRESLDAIGEALTENGRVIVTGCLGAQGSIVRDAHPQVLAVTGPQATAEVMGAVHAHLPQPHDPFTSLIPPQGVKLTPKHYAYLKIAEGCNHRCTFCIIPSMRGDLVSRPVGDVMTEAETLVRAGVKELLVISQDTSAYGVDVRYRTGFWQGRPLRTRLTELARAMSELGAWVRLHYVYPYPHVDELLPLMAAGRLLPYLDVPFQHASARILKLMKRPASADGNLDRIRAWRSICPELTIRSTFIVGFPGETEAEFEALLEFLEEAELDRSRLLRLLARRRRTCERSPRTRARSSEGRAARTLHGAAGENQRRAAPPQSGEVSECPRGRGERQPRARPFRRRRARDRRPRVRGEGPRASPSVTSPGCASSSPMPTISGPSRRLEDQPARPAVG